MPEPEDKREEMILFEKEVLAGTTWNEVGVNVAIINNRHNPVLVSIYALLPPPPPPKCGAELEIHSDSYSGIECSLEPGHISSHACHYRRLLIYWNPDNV